MSIKAYQAVQDKVTDPRRVEIMVFQRCNALLLAAASTGSAAAAAATTAEADPLAAQKRKAQALFEHERLWINLLADLAAEDNQLPARLRAQLISLGLWSCRHTAKVRKENASFAPLIDLNNQIIAGLTASLQAERSQAAAVAPFGPATPNVIT